MTWAILALVFLLRLPFLNQAIQGDDPYYIYGAEHAQIDPCIPRARATSFKATSSTCAAIRTRP